MPRGCLLCTQDFVLDREVPYRGGTPSPSGVLCEPYIIEDPSRIVPAGAAPGETPAVAVVICCLIGAFGQVLLLPPRLHPSLLLLL